MATTAIIPGTEKFKQAQSELERRCNALVVRDAETCLLAKQTQADIRVELKLRHAALDPFVILAKQNYDNAKAERERWIGPLETMDAKLEAARKEWERREREAAAAEERRINEERRRQAEAEAAEKRKQAETEAFEQRKAREKEIRQAAAAGDLSKREAERLKKEADAEAARKKAEAAAQEIQDRKVEDVKVQANIPTVQGVPSRVNWRYRVVDRLQVPEQYWMLNEQMIGADVRRDKDKTNIPGIEVYPE